MGSVDTVANAKVPNAKVPDALADQLTDRLTVEPTYAGLTTSKEVMRHRDSVNHAATARMLRSATEGLTLRVAMEDMRDVLVGVPRDVHSGKASLAELFGTGDRLRGLGLWLLTAAVCTIAFL